MNREICGQCGQSLDPGWVDERVPKLESMLREAIRERDSLRQHLHDEHQRHVGTMDERDAALADLAAARAECEEQARLNGMGAERELKLQTDLAAARKEATRLYEELSYYDALRIELQTANADLAAARADAERYRWLRSTNAFTLLAIAWSHPAAQAIGEDCDSAIDAALAGEKNNGT